MATFTALTTLSGQDAAERLAEALERLTPAPTGVGILEIEDGDGLWEVGAYFDAPPDRAGLMLLCAIHGSAAFAVSELPETDWVAHVRRELKPVEAGRFFVHGSHDADKVPGDKVALLIEASMAFGTGHHGTTKGCLLALDGLADDGLEVGSVLDLGCGTAVLALAAARLWPEAEVLASDIDPLAIEVARVNAAANGLGDRIACIEAEGLDHPVIAAAAPFDLVFANILKAPLIVLAPAVTAALAPGGRVILSGILDSQADEVIAAYGALGNNLSERLRIGDWTTAVLRKDNGHGGE